MSELEKIAEALYKLPKVGSMHVPGLVVATQALLESMDTQAALNQVANVAELTGIQGYSIAMPDIHWGYGFPIGGVAAMDPETGVISPGGVGYDINCGVRLAIIDVPFKDLSSKAKTKLLNQIFKNVPSGVGKGQKKAHALTEKDYKELIMQGSKWSVNNGFGFQNDIEHTESKGFIAGGDFQAVSSTAKERGKLQLGSIGSGNHFVEIGEVQTLYLPDVASQWGIEAGQIYVLIHSGSRGFGHQVCQDTLDFLVSQGFADNLKDKQLVAAPIKSPEGKKYFAAMAAAANFAFNNRQQILHAVRQSFKEALGISEERVKLLYDVCHNIAKFEEHEGKTLCVHRKGATRAFGPGHQELAPIYQKTGQPVLVPGDMGRASHLMVGLGNPLTFCSACHGAGRAKSRVKSRKAWSGRDPIAAMAKQGVEVMASSLRTIDEEMPDAYKDVDLVVEAVEKAHLAKQVARLKPHLVIKG